MGKSAKMRHRRRRRHSWLSTQEEKRVATIRAQVLEELGRKEGDPLTKKERNIIKARLNPNSRWRAHEQRGTN
jgi:hypothetical protein